MQQEYNIVIADTSCFILLDKINEMELLRNVFHSITTSEDIAAEYGKQLPTWVSIKKVTDKHYQSLLLLEVDNGEASAIALSMNSDNSLLILDDAKGRKLAQKLNLKYTGTLGVILMAKQSGIISEIKPLLQKIQRTNFRISESIYTELLIRAKE